MSFLENSFCPDFDNGTVFYLGYPLPFTKKELAVLKVLWAYKPCCVPANQIAKQLGNPEETAKNIAVHITHINRKAAAVGGCGILGCRKGVGYSFSFSENS